jgi:thiol-disulfide isomerase/thioredoxin
MAGDERIPVTARSPGRHVWLLRLLLGLGVAGLVAGLVLSALEAPSGASKVKGGQPAPAFTMERLGGGSVSLADLHGKIVMLDFWATWCPPCVKEIPSLVRVAKEFESRGLVFVAASRDEPLATARANVGIFVENSAPDLRPFVTFATDEVAGDYEVDAIPTLFLLDRDGKVIEAHSGALSEDQLRKRLAKIFEE